MVGAVGDLPSSHHSAWGEDFGREELPPISWGGGGCRREDLIQDSFHALNRTWTDDESFYTLSSGDSHRSFLSLSDDEDDEVSDPGGDSLLGFLEQTEVFRDILEPVESLHRVSRGRASFPPGSRGSRGRGSSQPVPEGQPGGTLHKFPSIHPFTQVPEHQHGGVLDQQDSQWGCTSVA